MRIVKRNDFIAMPYGTVFQKLRPFDLVGSLCIKCSNTNDIGNGFCSYPVASLEFEDDICTSYTDRDSLIEKMYKDSRLSYPMDQEASMRDGNYDKDDEVYFIVYEKDDIKKMIGTLVNCL